MVRTTLLEIGHPSRKTAELFIKDVYDLRYGAKLDTFPSRLMAHFEADGAISCAAGVRTEHDGFFSEAYLDAPIEEVLSITSGETIRRSQIFEVSTLASRAPRATTAFIDSIGRFGETNGFMWSFFTLTRRLHWLVERLGYPLIHLADADHRRISGHERWGTYYAFEPKVFAITSPRVALVRQNVGAPYAPAV
jgi:hypothetical protein